MPINQARPRLTEILEIVKREPVTITKDGTPVAIIVDPEDYSGLLAQGPFEGKRRLIVGPYRVVYEYDEKNGVVSIIAVARGGPLFR